MEKKEEEFKYLVRIAGTDINGNKKISYGLTRIKGIGNRMGKVICEAAGIDPNKKVGYLTEDEVEKLDNIIENVGGIGLPGWLLNRRVDYTTGKNIHVIGSDLIMSLREDINRMKKMKSYKGIRHALGLPVRGQRTRTSFRKGVIVGVMRRKMGKEAKK